MFDTFFINSSHNVFYLKCLSVTLMLLSATFSSVVCLFFHHNTPYHMSHRPLTHLISAYTFLNAFIVIYYSYLIYFLRRHRFHHYYFCHLSISTITFFVFSCMSKRLLMVLSNIVAWHRAVTHPIITPASPFVKFVVSKTLNLRTFRTIFPVIQRPR